MWDSLFKNGGTIATVLRTFKGLKAAVAVRLDRQKDANAVEKIPTFIAKAENRMNRLEKKCICPYMSIV